MCQTRIKINFRLFFSLQAEIGVEGKQLVHFWNGERSSMRVPLDTSALHQQGPVRYARAQTLGPDLKQQGLQAKDRDLQVDRPPYVPAYCPAFPASHSFLDTPVFDEREKGYSELETKKRRLKLEGDQSLAGLVGRTAHATHSAVPAPAPPNAHGRVTDSGETKGKGAQATETETCRVVLFFAVCVAPIPTVPTLVAQITSERGPDDEV